MTRTGSPHSGQFFSAPSCARSRGAETSSLGAPCEPSLGDGRLPSRPVAPFLLPPQPCLSFIAAATATKATYMHRPYHQEKEASPTCAYQGAGANGGVTFLST